MLTTEDRVFVAYSTGATGRVYVTGATWESAGGVFVASQFGTHGHVTLTDGTWNHSSNVQIAHGDNSTASVTLENGSEWDLTFGARIAGGEDCTANVYVNDGTWTAHAGIDVGGDQFNPSPGTGTVHVGANGTLDSTYALHIRSGSGVELAGGLLILSGETTLEGTLGTTTAGSTVRVRVGETAGGTGVVYLGDGVDLTNVNVEVALHPDATVDPLLTYTVFAPLDDEIIADALATAASLTTPADWTLNPVAGTLRFVSLPEALTGPDVPASAARRAAYDSDADDDLDLVDLAAYQRDYNAPA